MSYNYSKTIPDIRCPTYDLKRMICTCPPPPLNHSIEIHKPNLSRWRKGNTGIEGITILDSGRAGPHVSIVSLIHGNEYVGAIIISELLKRSFSPLHGRLSLIFANLVAFDHSTLQKPSLFRFVEEDLNRLWKTDLLKGGRRSLELDRARELCPFLDTVDILLDIHSMFWPSGPLILCGHRKKSIELARNIEIPGPIISDRGHKNGKRLIDYTNFSLPNNPSAACLLEAGTHCSGNSIIVARQAVYSLLYHVGMIADNYYQTTNKSRVTAHVTHIITAHSCRFQFVSSFYGNTVIPKCGTLIAFDGEEEIRTPYDNCILIMPNLLACRGHTAVRLAKPN